MMVMNLATDAAGRVNNLLCPEFAKLARNQRRGGNFPTLHERPRANMAHPLPFNRGSTMLERLRICREGRLRVARFAEELFGKTEAVADKSQWTLRFGSVAAMVQRDGEGVIARIHGHSSIFENPESIKLTTLDHAKLELRKDGVKFDLPNGQKSRKR